MLEGKSRLIAVLTNGPTAMQKHRPSVGDENQDARNERVICELNGKDKDTPPFSS